MNGYASNIVVTLHEDGIVDHDRGRRPRDSGRQASEDEEERARSDLHGAPCRRQVRAAATTRPPAAFTASARASSTRSRSELVATVKRDGAQWEMRFKQGKPVGAAEEDRAGARHRHDGLLPSRRDDLPEDRVRRRDHHASGSRSSSYLHKGVKVVFEDETDGREARLPAHRRARRLPEEDRRRARRRSRCTSAVHAAREHDEAACGSISCCSGPSRPTSTCAATSTASRPDRAARTRTACAPASARRSATSSTRTTSRRKA